MSTRGSVAIGTPKNWRGVYNHWDSYPTRLGKELWNHLQTVLKNGTTLEGFARDLLAYDDWRSYLNQGTCEYCGKRTTQPHSISGVIFMRDEKFKTKEEMRRHYRSLPAWKERKADIEAAIRQEWKIRENIQRTGYPDPEAKHHEHDTRPVEEQHITSDAPDPLFIEWVYVIDPETRTLHVLSSNGKAKLQSTPRSGDWCTSKSNGRWDYGHCVYWHEPVGSFLIVSPDPLPILCPEPNWEALEAKAR